MKKSVLEAKVRDDYKLGPVTAFSGYEYIKGEWREVPPGSEPAALAHPLLVVRDKESGEEILVTSQERLAAVTAETDETPAAEQESDDPAEGKKTKKTTRRSRRGED